MFGVNPIHIPFRTRYVIAVSSSSTWRPAPTCSWASPPVVMWSTLPMAMTKIVSTSHASHVTSCDCYTVCKHPVWTHGEYSHVTVMWHHVTTTWGVLYANILYESMVSTVTWLPALLYVNKVMRITWYFWQNSAFRRSANCHFSLPQPSLSWGIAEWVSIPYTAMSTRASVSGWWTSSYRGRLGTELCRWNNFFLMVITTFQTPLVTILTMFTLSPSL